MPPPVLKTSFLCFKCLGLAWTTEDTLVPLLTTEFAPLFGLRFTVPWLELELGVGLCGPPFLSSLLAVSDDPELTPEELQLKNKALLLKLNQNADYTCAPKCPHSRSSGLIKVWTLWSITVRWNSVYVKLHFECFTLIYDCKVLIRQIILSDYATVSNNCTMSSRNLSFTFIN